tara:strand:- start:380 stop:820 length:441 start_codon:yes stop_codon:yes gene_type:complete
MDIKKYSVIKTIKLILPWPPTVNSYYVSGKRGVYLSKKGKEFKWIVQQIIGPRFGPLFSEEDRVTLWVNAYVPDERTRDIDNLGKAILDSLEGDFNKEKKTFHWGGLYKNDSQIDDFRIVRCEKDPEGKGYIEVSVRSGKEWSDDI